MPKTAFNRYACSPVLHAAKRYFAAAMLYSVVAVAPGYSATPTNETAREQVEAAERAFAKSMADRDLRAFSRFVADEAIFFGGTKPLRGKSEVVKGWSRFYERGQPAPFSWAPDQVEVLESGTLALSTGLVRDPNGKVTGRFSSIWRLEAPGTWRVIFDKGSPPGPEDK
jgi:ketosteroid isomerase-like protein